MSKGRLMDVRELLKRAFSARDTPGIFDKLPEGLAESYFMHCELIDTIGHVKRQLSEAALGESLDRMEERLESNLQDILGCIGRLTDRTVIPYSTEEGDTLWKISKRHSSDLNEILKLNNIESILLPPGRTHLMIPQKNA
jgi:hypothetical protein